MAIGTTNPREDISLTGLLNNLTSPHTKIGKAMLMLLLNK